MKKKIFYAFRSVAKKFSGFGLRDRFPLINSLYTKISQRLSPESVIVLGHRMFLDPVDSMGLSTSGEYETLETQMIIKNLKPGHVVLDIGANIGYFTLIFARLTGSNGKVYAFEPDPSSFDLLRRNVDINGYKNVVLELKAVSNTISEAYLQKDRFNNLDHRIVQESKSSDDILVKTISLDDYPPLLHTSVDFVKLDIQGAEAMALDGMKNILSRSKQVKILTEFWPMGLERFAGGAVGYLQRLDRLGFVLFDIDQKTQALTLKTHDQLLAEYLPTFNVYTNLLCIRDV
jgi:FkbM family methyltransferase